MSEQFDSDLGRALKQGAGSELAGWEFTPAMRKNVLKRIQADQTGSAAPTEQRRTVALPRPLVWATLAAAAFMIMVNANIDLDGVGGSQKQSPELATQSAGGANGSAPALPVPAQAPSTPPQATPAPKGAANAGQSAAAPAAVSAYDAKGTVTAQGQARDVARAESRPTPVSIRLTAPTSAPTAQAQSVPEEKATMMAPAPPMAKSFAMTASVSRIALAAHGVNVLMLDSSGLTALNHDGVAAWQQPLQGVSFGSAMAVGADGRIAVSAASNVYVIGPAGGILQTLTLAEPASSVAWAPDGRLAVVSTAAEVYRDGKVQYKVPALAGSQLAFGPEGSLAVLEPVGNLFVYDREGKAVASRTQVQPVGLAFGPDENMIVTAGGALRRNLTDVAWKLPMEPQGLKVAGGTVIAWNADQVVGLRVADGAELWRATAEGVPGGIVQVVASDRRIVVVGATESGATLWAFHPTEGLKHTEGLSAVPTDVALVGQRITLLMPDGPQTVEIP